VIQGEFGLLEDRLSDALHAALVDQFVERRARTRQVSSPKPRQSVEIASSSAAGFRPFSVLDSLKQRILAETVAPTASGSDLGRFADLPHEAFSVDAEGFVLAEGQRLARLVRGRSLAQPEVAWLERTDVGAATRLRLERRLRAFARDWVGRLLAPVRELARSEVPALRAVAYQLELGLGTALRESLEPSLALLDSAAQAGLAELGVRVGQLSVNVVALSTSTARARRAQLVATFYPELARNSELPTPPCARGRLPLEAWLALGAVPLGPWVLRADLAERVADALEQGDDGLRPLSSLGVPRRERARVVAAVERMLQSRQETEVLHKRVV